MSIYTYACSGCGFRMYMARRIAERDNPASCQRCGASLRLLPDATQGLPRSSPGDIRSPTAVRSPGGPTLINCGAVGNGGAAIHSSGGHITVRNFVAIDNGGPAFSLVNDATVDADGVTHIARTNSKPVEPKKSRRKKPRRGKNR